MPRHARQEFEAGVHHVYARGVEKRLVFLDDRDRKLYLKLLEAEVIRQRWRCLSYCLMPNHVHLLIETREPNLGTGMRRLHGAYARAFNRRHNRWGHLFGERYGSTRIEDDAQMWMTVGYIARNPVEAKLVESPERWRWGSHAALTAANGAAPLPWLDRDRLYWFIGAFGGDPAQRYAECVTPGRAIDA